MPEESNPTGGEPLEQSAARPSARGKTVVCEFCECPISIESGEWKKLSDKAKDYRSLQDRFDAKVAELATLQTKYDDVKVKLDAALAAPAPEGKKKDFEFKL